MIGVKKYQIHIMLCLFDHYYLRHSWKKKYEAHDIKPHLRSPYYEKGTDSSLFYKGKKQREYQKKRLKMLVNRY